MCLASSRLQFSGKLSYDIHFRYVTTSHIDVHLGKVAF